ncbi:hypothetical protein [Paenibacillus sp. NPDC058071]|uniref:hypothetical protein n=1 Tax=Paenibacillus sp. NPDC058071 TaxID=3346326 RepID=UPI0036DB23F1
MATSKAKKTRKKLEQQGLLNPERLRGSWNGTNPKMRTTPLLHQTAEKWHNKHKRNHAYESDDSFYVIPIYLNSRQFCLLLSSK